MRQLPINCIICVDAHVEPALLELLESEQLPHTTMLSGAEGGLQRA